MYGVFKFILIFFIAGFFMISCSLTSGLGKPSGKLSKMQWMLGTWQNTQDDILFQEVWMKVSDNKFKGLSLMSVYGDTLYSAEMFISGEGSKIYYVDTIGGQKNIIPNRLLLVKSSAKKVRFKGLGNSPTIKITYVKTGRNEMILKSSSFEEGRRNDEKFIMNRAQGQY